MARFNIVKKDGSRSDYFWTDKDGSAPTAHRVYKETTDGSVKRMKNVRFDSTKNKLRKD